MGQRLESRISEWNPEDPRIWAETRPHSSRNLWISIPCLLVAFSVWIYWSVITVQMKNLAFPFTDPQLFTIAAIAGLAGATLRIPNSFMIALAGGRNVIAVSTWLLLLPTAGAGIALQNKATPFWVFLVLAALSGIGGGNFSSSMSNITGFFPKKEQGLALGLNAGLGNLGVSVAQLLLPLAMTLPLFGGLGGSGLALPAAIGGKAAGTLLFPQNAGLFWVPIVALLGLAAWWGLDNLPNLKVPHPGVAIAKATLLGLIGFLGTALGVYLLVYLKVNMWVTLIVTILFTLGLMKLIPGEIQNNLKRQFSIFSNKHTWIMTYLYVMTFGSFIGYSGALPLLIRIVFGQLPGGLPNPHAPNPFMYAWLGPLVGSLARPVGGWLSDKFGGAVVTFWDTVIMVGAALGTAYYVHMAHGSMTPEQYFMPFLGLFLLLFVTTGIGNGSTFRMVPVIFEPAQAGPVLGWTAAIAAYGAFVIPKVIGGQVDAGTPEYAFYGFAVYYVTCLFACWWWYSRKGAEAPC